MIFTDAELGYLSEHPLGRLATIGPGGAPHVQPVVVWVNAGTGTIDVGGPELARSQKFRNARADPRVSLVVDDQAETPNSIGQTGRGIEIRGSVEIVSLDPPLHPAFDSETLRIHPHRIVAWNIDAPIPDASGRPAHLHGYNSRDISRQPLLDGDPA
ncbi:PPOX class F420-dependent oxidoreductase [Nonomuraea zeae]|uniref:PPOX class F420-dependent oxidoreductase n=1 Tax=Nonomuraea zeae TaxID=1642303 RepID=A0A5S4GXQ5_9ACTN|nr:PPOX class F420-dependent oxidoreductase [Nonomuraea zeae]TMR37462.1 PPOX class F420-dependent oxidoreductase [Nonomuraea zeae]